MTAPLRHCDEPQARKQSRWAGGGSARDRFPWDGPHKPAVRGVAMTAKTTSAVALVVGMVGETRCGARDLELTRTSQGSGSGGGSRMAGNLVQGAVFTVMVVRAGMLRDPAFEPELAEQIRRS